MGIKRPLQMHQALEQDLLGESHQDRGQRASCEILKSKGHLSHIVTWGKEKRQ